MRFAPGPSARTIRVFLSSADDCLGLRDFFDAVVRDAVTPVLMDEAPGVVFLVDRWERVTAGKVPEGETGNAQFVARARRSNWVVCFVGEELRPGTQEELEAVLEVDGIELTIMWGVDRAGDWPDTHAGRWLDERKEAVHIERVGSVATEGARVALVRLMMQAIFEAIREIEARGESHERR